MMLTNGPATALRSSALTTFTLKVDGKALPGYLRIVTVDITRQLNRVPAARITLYDGDAAGQDFQASSSDDLVPGKALEIEGGYETQESLLFKGVITVQRIQVRAKGDSLLHIEARDPTFRMTLARKTRYFTELTDADLFTEIINGYSGLSAEVLATTVTYPEIVQYQVSDWDLMVARAEKIGMYCLAGDDAVRIGKPNLLQPPVLELTYGENVFGLDLELDSRTQTSKVTALAWDPANQSVISAEVEDVASPAQGNLSGKDLAGAGGVENIELRHSGALQQQEVDAWAEAGMQKSRFARIRGTVRFQGSQLVKPGDLVDLKGMGERFNGRAFVAGVRHMLGEGDWHTTIQVGLPPDWHHETYPVSAPPGAGYQPAINGLQVGVVTQLQDDPAGEERILVRLPLIGAQEDGIWSRLATLDAGGERGAVFRPEIGDEVVLGFVNDDPNQPVVLGMLHSSSKPAPIPASDDNHQKGLVTRSGMKLVFNDEAPSLSIETPNGNTIVIDDSNGSVAVNDENGNKLTMSSGGITLESAKNITLKASGDLSLEGINVSAKASTAAKIEGSVGAALKSSGTTEVKGSLVQIN
jgi:Rhs element Vgr protein